MDRRDLELDRLMARPAAIILLCPLANARPQHPVRARCSVTNGRAAGETANSPPTRPLHLLFQPVRSRDTVVLAAGQSPSAAAGTVLSFALLLFLLCSSRVS